MEENKSSKSNHKFKKFHNPTSRMNLSFEILKTLISSESSIDYEDAKEKKKLVALSVELADMLISENNKNKKIWPIKESKQ